MKTTETVKSLCSILSRCKSDLEDFASTSDGDMEYFQAQLRNVAVMAAQTKNPAIRHLIVPPEKNNFIFKSNERNNLRGICVSHYDAKNHEYATLDGFVDAGGTPTLVETRAIAPDKISTYFQNVQRKLAVLDTLFPKGYSWVLMLPSDFQMIDAHPLPTFKENGGEVAIMPYTAAEMQEFVNKYKPDKKDTTVVLVR